MDDIYTAANPMFNDPDDINSTTEQWFRDVEKALGFRLLYWQKYYILYGEMHMTGQTTAQILRDLFHKNTDAPKVTSKASAMYANEFKQMRTLLQKKGIE